VEGERVELADQLELAQARTAWHHVVLGVHLDPGEPGRRPLDEIGDVRVAEPDPGPALEFSCSLIREAS
jgi:hypothetical protein